VKYRPKYPLPAWDSAEQPWQASSRRTYVAELKKEWCQWSGDLVLTGRIHHLSDVRLFIGNLLLAVHAGTASVITRFAQENIGCAATRPGP
jgi:hypothetical protein